jgi:hypothetical protein
MSITDLIKRTVLAEFRADTSQAGREIDSLIAKHDRLKASTAAAAKGQSAHFDQLVLELTRSNKAAEDGAMSWEGWKKSTTTAKASHEQLLTAVAKGAIVFGTIKAAVDFARDSLNSYGEQLRLESKTGGVNIDKLSESFDGLINHHELLQFAASSSSGVLKLNQQQMETVGNAALALRSRGFDLAESFEKLKDAAVKGKVEGLDDLGLAIEKGESNAETLKNLMTELNKVIAENGGASKTAADDVERLAVAWDNAKEKVKGYTAQALIAAAQDVSPESIKQRYIENGWSNFRNLFPDDSWYKTQHAFATGMNSGRQQVKDSAVIEMDDLNVSRTEGERKKLAEEAATRAAEAILRSAIASTERNVEGLRTTSSSLGTAADMTIRNEYGTEQDYIGDTIRRTDEFYSNVRDFEASRGDRTQSFLETVFGPVEEFNTYETAFGTLTTATNSAMSAWISGSMSLGQAVKKGIGDALGALASKLAAHALEHALFAGGSLAFGDFAGAAKHAAMAVAFGTGAATVATVARSMNGHVATVGGAGSSGGGGGSSSSGSSNDGPVVRDHRTGTGENYNAPIVFVVGEHFTDMSPRQRAQEAEQTAKRAFGSTGSRDS